MRQDFDGHRVIVTGAAGGLGAATVDAFLAEGATVAAVDMNEVDPSAFSADHAARLTSFVADVSDEAEVRDVVKAITEIAPATDLVNIAGIGSTTTAPETPINVWDRVMAVNARGTFLMCKHVLPGMIENGSGSIVNVASIAGLVGLRQRVAYSASKGAIISMTRALAVDHGADGIRVNCLCPGTIDTPWIERLAGRGGPWLDALLERQLIARLGTADEIAQAVLYLASDRAAFATGTVLTIDGGLTAV